jgi:hypothetical protein
MQFFKQNFEMGFDDIITEFQNSIQGCACAGDGILYGGV